MKYGLDITLGILGGGQLARFLSLKAQEMGLKVRVLCESKADPAALVTQDVIIGKPANKFSLERFLDGLSAVTFESEFIDPTLLDGVDNVFPSLQTMSLIRDRLTQKQLLHKYGVPTSPLISFHSNQDLGEWLKINKSGLVMKKRLFGYDGYGTVILKSSKDLQNSKIEFTPKEWICEEFTGFKRELAFALARSKSGSFYELPLVETRQENSRCDWVKGPIQYSGLTKTINKFKKLMLDVKYVGLLSIELFDTKNGLVVNELAPRVHNSGHYSLEALEVSQFEAHLRAVLDMPFPKTKLNSKGFSMVNLIGSGTPKPLFSADPTGYLHWYGKSENKAGRKMGHFTVLGASSETSLRQALAWRGRSKI